MTTYLNKDNCERLLKKSVATDVKRLNQISFITDKDSEEYKKLFTELTIINDMIESINKYIDLLG